MNRDKQLIELFVADFNLWAGASYSVEAWPDAETRDRKAIDALARAADGRELAVEHTLLQPFIGDRADAVPFLKTAGLLDRRDDLAEPGWMIDLVFEVGAVPKGIDWTKVGQRLEEWFVAVRPSLPEGRASYQVDELPFSLNVTVDRSRLPDTPGCVFVARRMPNETVELVLRDALSAKLPKLAATTATERILLLEMDSPVRGYWEIGATVDAVRLDFPDLVAISSIWIGRTVAWESEGYVGFHLIWPLPQALKHQEWYKVRPNKWLHPTVGRK